MQTCFEPRARSFYQKIPKLELETKKTEMVKITKHVKMAIVF